ncbi:hypothetical protein ABQZ99_005530 [Xanthomonas hortorum pv. vitians]|uniref:hypothetical protein n=1 Tax=Xanthomonas hortorum TaxID=56454 RepID=UPI001F40CC3C|nr:hypothetical protein [Xanthomonas hortorum]MCE4517881.1 hypothetical protein [Xanthomonas hortorum pv. vitians]
MSALFKQQAHQLVDALPEDARWEDLIYQAALHRAIEKGIEEADDGQLIAAEDVLRQLELSA